MSSPPHNITPSSSSDSTSPPRQTQTHHSRSDSRRSSRRISGNFQAPHPPYGAGGVLSTHHRSDSSTSLSRGYDSPRSATFDRGNSGSKSLGTRSVNSSNSPPLIHTSHAAENEQDMADLTAEMALLDDDDTRTGRSVLTAGRGTGGLRPLSLGSKKYNRHSRVLSTDSFYDDSRPGSAYTNEKGDYLDNGLETPGFDSFKVAQKRKRLAMWDKFIYRLRFCLRLIALIACGVVTAALAHVTSVYSRTKNQKDKHGNTVWPESMNLEPTNLLLAGAVIATVVTLLWMALSVKTSVKMVVGGKMTLAAVFSTLLTFGIWIGTIVHCWVMKHDGEAMKTMFWVCELSKNKPEFANEIEAIDFQFHCGEIRFGWFTSWGVAVTDFLILITIIAGWLLRWWNIGGRQADTYFWSAPPLAEVRRRRGGDD